MPAAAPLQILLFKHHGDTEVLPYENAIIRAFQGGKEAAEYLATGEDLGIQLEVFADAPPQAAPETLDAFHHTLAVVFADSYLLASSSSRLWGWLLSCWTHAEASGGRHLMLVVAMDERQGRTLVTKWPDFAALQIFHVHTLGEHAIRPAMLALRILHECRVLLATALPSTTSHKSGYLRLFISHAKMDGLPLANALKHQIDSTGWLEDFYDAEDLPSGRDWQRELEHGVGSSLIIMLRTNAYDGRPWCRQEVLWADEYATPAVLVDARTDLNHAAGVLPFDRVPTARIPDGNLFRILFLALREGLRFLHFARRIEGMKQAGILPSLIELRVFSYAPSMSALLRACNSLKGARVPTTTPHYIVYPDPPLRAGAYEAAMALVESYAPSGTHLVTPNSIATMVWSP